MQVSPFTHPSLTSPRLIHGFFGRAGGISAGLYAGLNCGTGSHDDQAHVNENRARAAQSLGLMPDKLCTLHQVHSSRAVIVDAPLTGAPPQADALVTKTAGVALGILTADCAPVLLADMAAGVVGAAHAGWKGAAGGVVAAAVAAMETLGASRSNITAVIGPCIAQLSYEVGAEFIERFSPVNQQRFFIPGDRDGFHHFDLAAYVAQTALTEGLQRVAIVTMDTYGNPDGFFSYRRATLNGEPDYGRQISVIALK